MLRAVPAASWMLPAFFVWACAQAPVDVNGAPRAPATAAPHVAESAPGPSPTFFGRRLQMPEGRLEVFRLSAKGFQIFRCEAHGSGARWAFRLPEAELRDASGQLLVRHGAGLSFEHVDGSRLVGEIIDHVPAGDEGSLPWVLMRTRSFGRGALSDITHVQRINTDGGMPPGHCDPAQINDILRVPFHAEFVFFR